MPIVDKLLRHNQGGVTFEACACWDDSSAALRPLVLVAPTFWGRTAFEESKARSLAELGYVAVAIDIYGIGHWPEGDMDRGWTAMNTVDNDRALLKARMLAALDTALTADMPVDRSKVAAIGYCYGGKSVLDLARCGADVAGVVSFHGAYDPPPFPNEAIKAKVLILHGWEDYIGPPEKVVALATELTETGADWQIHAYGRTEHGFTLPTSPDYSPAADRRSWQAMLNFLDEILG